MDDKKSNIIIEKACDIISSNLGETTAGYYREFYRNKNLNVILMSLEEILSDVVGLQKSKKQIEEIKNLLK